MRKYESLYIIHPDVVGDELTAMMEKFQSVLTEQNAEILKFDNWGTRKLAYPIKKQTKGCYVQTIFEADATVIAEYERRLRLDEKILRFMTLLFDGELVEAPVEETPVSTEETPVSTEETPVSTEETPVSTEETPVSTEETPVSTEETPVSTEEAAEETESTEIAD